MAANNDSDALNSLIECGVCHKPLEDAKLLKCLHSFCKGCINGYVTDDSSPNGGAADCPVCRTPINIDVDNMEHDFFVSSVVSLLDTARTGKAAQCVQHGEILIHFCKSCQRYVCSQCVQCEHKTCQVDAIQNIPSSTMQSWCHDSLSAVKSSASLLKQSLAESCDGLNVVQKNMEKNKQEVGEQIKLFYCRLRDQMFRYMIQQEEDLLQDLDIEFETECNSEQRKMLWCQSVLKELENKERVLARFDGKGDPVAMHQFLAEMTSQTRSFDDMLKSQTPSSIACTFKPNARSQEQILNAYYADICITSTDEVEGAVQELNLRTSQTGQEGHQSVRSYSSQSVHSAPSQELHGQQRVSAVADNSTTSGPSAEAEEAPPPYSETIGFGQRQPDPPKPFECGIKLTSFRSILPDDTKTGYAVGIAWVDDRLIMTDRWNRRLKMFGMNGKHLQGMAFMDGEPWDVSIIPNPPGYTPSRNESRFCLVTIPKSKTIMKIVVPCEGPLTVSTNIRTVVGYTCLAYNIADSTIVCGVCNPFGLPRVDVIGNTMGNVLKSFAVDSAGRALFTYPRSIDVNFDGTITVCDWTRKQLVFLRSDGYIYGHYRGSQTNVLKEPIGTSLDGRGHVLVADKKSQNIHIVKLDGTGVGVLQINMALKEPREICISTEDPNYPKMAITYGSGYVLVLDLLEYNQVPSAPSRDDVYPYTESPYDNFYPSTQI